MSDGSSWEQLFDAHAPVHDENVFTKDTRREVDCRSPDSTGS